MMLKCPKCENTSRFTRDVTDLEYLDGDGKVVAREPRAEEGAPRCVYCGYPAVEVKGGEEVISSWIDPSVEMNDMTDSISW